MYYVTYILNDYMRRIKFYSLEEAIQYAIFERMHGVKDVKIFNDCGELINIDLT